MKKIKEIYKKDDVVIFIFHLLLVLFCSQFNFLWSTQYIVRLLLISTILFQNIVLFLTNFNKKNDYVIYINSLMAFIHLKIIFFDKFGFVFTYLLGHFFMLYIEFQFLNFLDPNIIKNNKKKIIYLLIIISVLYFLGMKTERILVDILNVLLFYFYVIISIYILYKMRKKIKYFNVFQKSLLISIVFGSIFIYIINFFINEKGIFFDGDKLLIFSSFSMLILNDVFINKKLNFNKVFIILITTWMVLILKWEYFLVLSILIIILMTWIIFKDFNIKYLKFFYSANSLEKEYKNNISFINFLHDDLLQDLIRLKLESNENNIKYELTTLIHKIRSYINDHSNELLFNISLKENFRILIDSIGKKYPNKVIVVDFYCEDDFYISSPYDIYLYRCIKELLNNIYKHTEAIFASIEIKSTDQFLTLEVINDNSSKDLEASNTIDFGNGLKSIQYETKMLNGKMHIKSDEEFHITIKVPIEGRKYLESIIS